MKKNFVFIAIFAMLGLINTNAMEISSKKENISYAYNSYYYISFMHYSDSYGLSFFDTGSCRHWTPENRYNCRNGEYYVQDEIIYIRWSNGQQEKIELNYNSDGKAYIYYKGRYYYDGYNGR